MAMKVNGGVRVEPAVVKQAETEQLEKAAQGAAAAAQKLWEMMGSPTSIAPTPIQDKYDGTSKAVASTSTTQRPTEQRDYASRAFASQRGMFEVVEVQDSAPATKSFADLLKSDSSLKRDIETTRDEWKNADLIEVERLSDMGVTALTAGPDGLADLVLELSKGRPAKEKANFIRIMRDAVVPRLAGPSGVASDADDKAMERLLKLDDAYKTAYDKAFSSGDKESIGDQLMAAMIEAAGPAFPNGYRRMVADYPRAMKGLSPEARANVEAALAKAQAGDDFEEIPTLSAQTGDDLGEIPRRQVGAGAPVSEPVEAYEPRMPGDGGGPFEP